MAAEVDPTYPLYPIACFVAATMLLLVLLTSFIRQNWNFGVTSLCFWLFWEILTYGINAIIWSDNKDVRLYTYCDIVTHVQVIAYVIKPMATLIITRRLYLSANCQAAEFPDEVAKRRNLILEWTPGLAIPVVVAGPLYYIVQEARFVIFVRFGCQRAPDASVLGTLLFYSWGLIPPLLSVIVYYPRVIRSLYHQKQNTHKIQRSTSSGSRINYFRVFALASLDLILTLPIGIVYIVFIVKDSLTQHGHFPVYGGWTFLHGPGLREPAGFTYAQLQATNTAAPAYFIRWSSVVLAYAIFGLFGFTVEARASYWHAIYTVGGWFQRTPSIRTLKARSPLGSMKSKKRPQDTPVELDVNISQSRCIKTDACEQEVGTESEGGLDSTRELESRSDFKLEFAEGPGILSIDTAGARWHPTQHDKCGPDDANLVNALNAV